MAKKNVARRDYQQEIVDKIVSLLEQDLKPFSNPWEKTGSDGFPLRVTGEPYKGINVISLWCDAQICGYTSPYWMTYRQAKELGGQVRKDESGSLVIKYGTFDAGTEKDGEKIEDMRGYLKGYAVFNADQIEGLPEKFKPKTERNPYPIAARRGDLDEFFGSIGATILIGGDSAEYRPLSDTIKMPTYEAFPDSEKYYSTLAHEATHWTGGEKRLCRGLEKLLTKEQRAEEELIAEIGSAFLGAQLGLRPDHIEDHAVYIKSWLVALKNDKKFLFRAAAAAQKAVDLLNANVAEAQKKKAA